MNLLPDSLLNNRYKILQKLGQGGMGAVYLATDMVLDHPVAVKMNRNPSAESSTQFLREARLLASLRHPNLPRVTDYFILDGAQYLVMDYIPGKDLDTVIKTEGQQPVATVLEWARQLGSALIYLHHQNPPIIHRDIKPSNVRLSSEGQVILVDFGIAKVADSSQATTAGAIGFTPGYAPPEQYTGITRTGPYTDQYAFAALLYHLLTARKPAESVQRALGEDTLAPLIQLRSDVPQQISDAIDKALSLRVEERFGSIDQFVEQVRSASVSPTTGADVPTRIQAHSTPPATVNLDSPTIVDHKPPAALEKTAVQPKVVPPAPIPVEAPTKPPTRRSLWFAIGMVALVIIGLGILLAAGGMLMLAQSSAALSKVSGSATIPVITEALSTATQAPVVLADAATATLTVQPSDTPAPLPTETLPPTETATSLPTDTLPPSPTPPPFAGGGLVAFASNRADGQTFQIWTMRLTLNDQGSVVATDFTQLTNTPGNKFSPVWSPDNNRLLYVAEGGPGMGLDIWVINADGSGQPFDLTRRKGDDTAPAWSPDGKWIAFTNNGREDGVKQLYLTAPDGSDAYRLSYDQEEFDAAWSPDNQWLGFVMNAAGAQIMFMRSRTDVDNTASREFYVTPQRFDKMELKGNLGHVSQPAWSPDGNWLTYARVEGNSTRIGLAHYPVNDPTRDVVMLTNGPKDSHPTWSPDGQWIMFTSEHDGNAEIYIMQYIGQLQTNLTNAPGQDIDAAWQVIK